MNAVAGYPNEQVLGSGRFGTSKMVNARVALIDELTADVRSPDAKAAQATLKAASAGGWISGERKHENMGDGAIRARCTIWAGSNSVPAWAQAASEAGAWARRMRVVPMNTPVGGGAIESWEKAVVAVEGRQIALRCVAEYAAWCQAGKPVPQVVQQATESAARAGLSPVQRWIADCIERTGPDSEITTLQIQASWESHASYDAEIKAQALGQSLSKLADATRRESRQGKKVTVYAGLRLR